MFGAVPGLLLHLRPFPPCVVEVTAVECRLGIPSLVSARSRIEHPYMSERLLSLASHSAAAWKLRPRLQNTSISWCVRAQLAAVQHLPTLYDPLPSALLFVLTGLHLAWLLWPSWVRSAAPMYHQSVPAMPELLRVRVDRKSVV